MPILDKPLAPAGMSTISIALAAGMKAFVDEQVAQRGYASSGEYIRDLIRRDQERVQLRGAVLEGAASPRTGEVDEKHFEALRERAQAAPKRPP
jgi:antitoxin ParD1/3/4